MSSSSELSISLANRDWSNADMLAKQVPSLAAMWTKRPGLFEGVKKSHCIPLHEACLSTAPASTVKAILEAHPDGARTKESSYSRLPLHCACKRANADPVVVAILVKAHSSGCLVPDSIGRLPIHYALSNNADSIIIRLLLSAQPDSAKGVDLNGWSPLHVACSVGNKGAIIALLQIYPEATFSRTDKGSMPSMCLSKSIEDRDDVQRMIREARQQFDSKFVNPLSARRLSLVSETNSVIV